MCEENHSKSSTDDEWDYRDFKFPFSKGTALSQYKISFLEHSFAKKEKHVLFGKLCWSRIINVPLSSASEEVLFAVLTQ